MATFNGTELILVLNGDPVACELNSSMTVEESPIDTTCKSSQGWEDNEAGMFSATFECEAITNESEVFGINEFMDAILEKEELEIRFRLQDSSRIYASQGRVVSIKENAQTEDKVTYTATIKANGILTNNPGAYFQFIEENWEEVNTNWEDL